MSLDATPTPVLPPDTTSFHVDYVEKRSRLSTLVRLILCIPHLILLSIWGIAIFFAVVIAWFAVVFTGKYPEGIYNFVTSYERTYARFSAYCWLMTDEFPPFDGNLDTPYPVQFAVGPPKESYSRLKAFFRFFLIIPFYIIAYVFGILLEIVGIVAWVVIVITGKQPKGLQDALQLFLSYTLRIMPFYTLQTEDWPKISDDEVSSGPPTGGFTPAAPASAPYATEPPFQSAPPAPPAFPTPPTPPMPPEPPAPPTPPSV